MNSERIKLIIKQELNLAEQRIIGRIEEEGVMEMNNYELNSNNIDEVTPLPSNENYRRTLDLLNEGKSQTEIARILGVTIQSIRRYINWLIRNGYYEGNVNGDLTDREEQVAELVYKQNKSISDVSVIMGCTAENIKSIHDNLIAKGHLTDPFIKVVYPDFYRDLSNPRIGFPKNRYKLAKQVRQGQLCYIYLSSPCKKVVALVKINSDLIITQNDRWPYVFEVEIIIPPKEGVRLSEAGINKRLRIGDTHICISNQNNVDLMNKLNAQPNLITEEIEDFINSVDRYLNNNREHN